MDLEGMKQCVNTWDQIFFIIVHTSTLYSTTYQVKIFSLTVYSNTFHMERHNHICDVSSNEFVDRKHTKLVGG